MSEQAEFGNGKREKGGFFGRQTSEWHTDGANKTITTTVGLYLKHGRMFQTESAYKVPHFAESKEKRQTTFWNKVRQDGTLKPNNVSFDGGDWWGTEEQQANRILTRCRQADNMEDSFSQDHNQYFAFF